MIKRELPHFLYGGDYNPEQWPEETWAEDIKVFKQADINSATINVFSWALLEPQEGKYDFTKLDKIIKELTVADFDIVLATSTAAMPAWMFKNTQMLRGSTTKDAAMYLVPGITFAQAVKITGA